MALASTLVALFVFQCISDTLIEREIKGVKAIKLALLVVDFYLYLCLRVVVTALFVQSLQCVHDICKLFVHFSFALPFSAGPDFFIQTGCFGLGCL